jgi:hexosaminidase
MAADVMESLNLDLVPEPQRLTPGEGFLKTGDGVRILLPPGAEEADRFAAEYLAECLARDQGIRAAVGGQGGAAVHLGRATGLRPQGYRLTITPGEVRIEGSDAAGLYYGTQTLRQCFFRHAGQAWAPAVAVEDWPDLPHRAVHYDTKHHQDKFEYVQDFLRELAAHKINVLVWEWEDKFAYEKYPMVGAPGAFTKSQMQDLQALALRHHVQIVPLVQGLGHVSYILKHRTFDALREIPDSDWEFCPLKEGTYEVLFSLWDEAIEATPGSEFLHIGCDETYELGLGVACGCAAKAAEIGTDGLMQLFLKRCVEHVQGRGRRCVSWGGRWKAGAAVEPPKGMILGAYTMPAECLKAARDAGHPCWVYGPNPGIEPLFLPLLPFARGTMWRLDPYREHRGNFRDVAETIGPAAADGVVEGSITTSWDDAGLHNQCWMPRFLCAAEFSWKGVGRDVDTWLRRWLAEYFGPAARDMRELFVALQDGAIFFYDTFQRGVFQWCDIGKMHLPDFPRAGLEFDNFWRRRYMHLLNRAKQERIRARRALDILDDNLARDVRHRYDLEVFRTCAEMMRHNCDLILMLGELEAAIERASNLHFADRWPCYPPPNYVPTVDAPDHAAALAQLKRAEALIEQHLADRRQVFENLLAVWERTRLPKGLRLPGKPYVFARERARHYANRTPDMTYLILDEQLLDLEGYLAKLKDYIFEYESQTR